MDCQKCFNFVVVLCIFLLFWIKFIYGKYLSAFNSMSLFMKPRILYSLPTNHSTCIVHILECCHVAHIVSLLSFCQNVLLHTSVKSHLPLVCPFWQTVYVLLLSSHTVHHTFWNLLLPASLEMLSQQTENVYPKNNNGRDVDIQDTSLSTALHSDKRPIIRTLVMPLSQLFFIQVAPIAFIAWALIFLKCLLKICFNTIVCIPFISLLVYLFSVGLIWNSWFWKQWKISLLFL